MGFFHKLKNIISKKENNDNKDLEKYHKGSENTRDELVSKLNGFYA